MAKASSTAVPADETADAVTGEITKSTSLFASAELRNIRTLDDAKNLFAAKGLPTFLAKDVLGDGFEICENKDRLIGVGLFLIQWSFPLGDYPDKETGERSRFAVVRAVTENNEPIVLIDGGNGICNQLMTLTYDPTEPEPVWGGVFVPKGLSKSEYDNEYGHGVTYYLATS